MKSKRAQGAVEYVILVFLIALIVYAVLHITIDKNKNQQNSADQEAGRVIKK